MKKHIPNIITILRVAFIPAVVVFMVRHEFVTAALIFLVAGLSDMLDGYLARKWKVVSTFGKLIDPLADKAIQISAILLLCIVGKLHFAFIILLFIKEALLILGSYLLYKKKIVVFATWYGKAATLLLNSAIFWPLVLNLNNIWFNSFMAIAMTAELIAFILYTVRYFKLKNKEEIESEFSM